MVSSPSPSESAVEGTGERVEAPEPTGGAPLELAEAGRAPSEPVGAGGPLPEFAQAGVTPECAEVWGAPPELAEAETEEAPTAGDEKKTRKGIVPQAGDGARGLTGARP